MSCLSPRIRRIDISDATPLPVRWMRRGLWLLLVAFCVATPSPSAAQGTGALIGTVSDGSGGVVAGAVARMSSPSLIGRSATVTTNAKGQARFTALPSGLYVLEVEFKGFSTYHERDIYIGAGATIERRPVLRVAGVSESIVVEGAGSRIDARDSGFGTRFGRDDLNAIPTRRASMFDMIRATPGISPTSPAGGGSTTVTTVSAFGSGTNENQFLIDGGNYTCPCNGIARAEPGIDFIQEIQVQSVGASAEYGNVQGAVINVVMRQGGERYVYDASHFGQSAGLTSRPVSLAIPGAGQRTSAYQRARYRDFTTNLGGPAVRDRLWFFLGYQHLRDYDSQPGTVPEFPRQHEQDKIFAKLTWKLTPNMQLSQSFHDEFWVNPVTPTLATPFEATTRTNASVPAFTIGHLTHTLSATTMWDVRAGGFVFSQESPPSTGDRSVPSRFDRATGLTSGAPSQFGALTIRRINAKATLSHYRPGVLGADHQWKLGGQVERGDHHSPVVIPTGLRYVDNGGQPFQTVSRDPSHEGGEVVTAAAFVSDALTFGDRLTVNAGVRFDHSRAISQDLHTLDSEGRETGGVVRGLGQLYTWSLVSPRLGVTAKLTADGKAIARASFGRFNQGVLTGELGQFHPGVTPTTTAAFEAATGWYTKVISVIDARNLQIDRQMKAPRTDEFSVALEREVGPRLALAAAYIHKVGANFIGWTDVGGIYRDETRTLPDGRSIPVSVLVNSPSARTFLLTNPPEYSLTYNGLVLAAEKRRAHGWHAFGSYTLSRATGLQASSGAFAAGPQVSTIAPPNFVTFGRDPNDLTNADGRLPNDRPHMFRLMGSVDVAKTGVVIAANLQHFSGKPWAATAQILLPQGDQRVLLEPRGSLRLSSQSLLDLRISKRFGFGRAARIELLIDVLNVLNDTAEEALVTDNYFSANFGKPTVYIDPRRAMLGVRMNLGR